MKQVTNHLKPSDSQVDEVRRALAKVIRPEYLENWLSTPNPVFSGIRPNEMIEQMGDRPNSANDLRTRIGRTRLNPATSVGVHLVDFKL